MTSENITSQENMLTISTNREVKTKTNISHVRAACAPLPLVRQEVLEAHIVVDSKSSSVYMHMKRVSFYTHLPVV